MKLLLITSVFSLYIHPSSKTIILHSPIFPLLSSLKLHHSVLISADKTKHSTKTPSIDSSYLIIDFSPINQSISTMTKLLFSQNIPAEIRIRYIGSLQKFKTKQDVLEYWYSVNNGLSDVESQQLSNHVVNTVINKNHYLKSKLSNILVWDKQMNLYTHNCQHFGVYVKNIMEDDDRQYNHEQ